MDVVTYALLKKIKSIAFNYLGSVPTTDDLPANPARGDLYTVDEDASDWVWDGTKWFKTNEVISNEQIDALFD